MDTAVSHSSDARADAGVTEHNTHPDPEVQMVSNGGVRLVGLFT